MRQMVKNVRGNAECVTCHPFAYIKLGGVLDWKLGDGCKTKECRANATVSRWKLERRVLGTGDDFTDMGTASSECSASSPLLVCKQRWLNVPRQSVGTVGSVGDTRWRLC